jgi:P27 family predicted phage terminase small subunit
MGVSPKPTALKVAAGNPGKRPLNLKEPKPQSGEPRMPTGLSAGARKEWRSVVPELVKLGVLASVDGQALAAYCEASAMWAQCRKDIKANGLIYRVGTGIIKKNPSVDIAFVAMKTMKAFMCEFGLTPASRTRIAVSLPPAEADPVAEFFSAAKAV